MTEALLAGALTPEERGRAEARLYALAARQTELYLAGAGTSVSAETAQELLRSLVFTLRSAAGEEPARALLTADPEALLRRGQAALAEKTRRAEALWAEACRTAPAPAAENVFYRQSLAELGCFSRRYDRLFFAHRVPCVVDYPLCLPVPDEAQGAAFAEAWLERLVTENRLLSGCGQEPLRALLERTDPRWREAPLNLCEQAAVNAAGLAALGESGDSLVLTERDRARLAALLRPPERMEGVLERAARTAAERLAPGRRDAADYVRALLRALRPRLASALETDGLAGVFR